MKDGAGTDMKFDCEQEFSQSPDHDESNLSEDSDIDLPVGPDCAHDLEITRAPVHERDDPIQWLAYRRLCVMVPRPSATMVWDMPTAKPASATPTTKTIVRTETTPTSTARSQTATTTAVLKQRSRTSRALLTTSSAASSCTLLTMRWLA